MFEIGQFVVFSRSKSVIEFGRINRVTRTAVGSIYRIKSLADNRIVASRYYDWELEPASDSDVLLYLLER